MVFKIFYSSCSHIKKTSGREVKGVKHKFSEGIGFEVFPRDHRQTIPSLLRETSLVPFANTLNLKILAV